jgi:GT2 family glycosyltransferase
VGRQAKRRIVTRVKPEIASKTQLQTPEDRTPDDHYPLPSVAFPDGFDEDAYLAANPDVTAAVASGECRSGYFHYLTVGWREKRPLFETGSEPRGRIIRTLPKLAVPLASSIEVQLTVEAVLVSDAGGLLVVGWLDDSDVPLDYFRVNAAGWYFTFDLASVVRFRRRDVETAIGLSRVHGFGFLAFAFLTETLDVSGGCELVVGLQGVGHSTVAFKPRRVPDTELRNVVLSYVAESEFFGNRQIEAMRVLDGSVGRHIIDHNLHITRKVVGGAFVERFGQTARRLRGSIVVCLYGKPEYLFLQNAMFAGGPGFEDYELVYVSNSPEMAERLLKEARAAQQIYGLPQTIVLLPGNAGFGAANNVAASHAQSDRILIVNPDVFPRDPDWARRHSEVVAGLPQNVTRIFGVPLYYDDSSLMHGGMYFESDTGISLDGDQVLQRRILRVEHFGKGAPVWATQFTEPRPVPAVTGAFMSLDRAWYERLGGFTESYVFGHYEDADLCLKSIQSGIVPWIHDIRLWHLEGQGSHRLPVHEGGTLVNRWLFSRTWSDLAADGLLGPKPTDPIMRDPQSVTGAGVGEPAASPALAPLHALAPAPAGSVAGPALKRMARRSPSGGAHAAKRGLA